ncbi:S-locus lectin protein kinase family protein [Prunus dulcis]|uniref:S-locus lectin protein kinase family protein n=1 Tax=Prunus dulcis TaxID=3755 RepID=A0A4Y1RPD9_PRUDU|nr:S-locus lectin protein kinase family protein [Prunus dulcis]
MATIASSEARLSSLRQGSSLKVEEESDFLVSPNGTFSSGFYKVDTNASCYSIWFTNSVNKTVVWMANRDKPVSRRVSKLTLHRNGNLVLTDGVGSLYGVEAQLLETGNLVLINQEKMIIWQSFDSPTDTLLPSQRLVKNTTLVSVRSQGTYLSGFYNFRFYDNNDKTVFDFKRTPYNSSKVAILDEAGQFISSDDLMFNASDYGIGPKRRLTMDYDGILRLYSLDESTGLWEMSWLPDGVDACLVHGLCGAYAAQVSLKTSNLEVEKSNKNRYMVYLVGFVSSFAIIEAICIGLTWWYAFRKHAHEEFVNMGYIALAMGFKRFTYAELKRATMASNRRWELGLEQRYNIALGTAKGLSYLHEECLEWVLHCDVKPQNILLDDHLEPKVADFGMSKLFKDIQGIRDIDGMGFSKVRGTRGYMAPEWMMNLKIDAKADVYSYGIVLLELLSGKSASILIRSCQRVQ